MSIEQAMILRARPQMMANRLAARVANEITKGCTPELSLQPCRLEPRFHPIFAEREPEDDGHAVDEDPIPPEQLTRCRLWAAPKQDCRWDKSELFLKHLSRLAHRIGFEVSGNQKGIRVNLLAHCDDVPVISTAFRAQFDESEITKDSDPPLQILSDSTEQHVRFYDFFPPPPYSHLLTSYEELKISSLTGLIQALSQLPESTIGFHQCLFQPVAPLNNWHNNVETLLDFEFQAKLHRTANSNRQSLQQGPSGDLHQMSREVDTKAHNDRPFFCAAVRVGLCSPDVLQENDLRSLASFLNLFQHGGRPLGYLTDMDYERVVSRSSLGRMILRGITLRPGFLVNSRELVGFAHLFPAGMLESRRVPLTPLETLHVRDSALFIGTKIGICNYAGTSETVCIPPIDRKHSTHVMACPGMGKTELLINMFLQDICEGKSAIFLDVHGDAIQKLREHISPDLYHKCVDFSLTDPEWIPVWNPLKIPPGGNVYRLAGNFISAMKQVFDDWGDRMEHVYRNSVIGVSPLPGANLLDLYHLARSGSPESDEIRKQIIKTTSDDAVKKFWQSDFLKDYRRADLAAPKHKLSKLVSAGNVSLMLSQPDSLINLGAIMDAGGILLVDLSSLDNYLAGTLGSFMLELVFSTAISRSSQKEDERQQVSIFVDEAHRFVSANAIEDLIVQARKFGIDLCIAHQFLSQFNSRKIDALSTTGCTILGKIDRRDSEYFTKDLQDLVDPKDIFKLQRYEMIARIGREVVRFKTSKVADPPVGSDWRKLVEMSRRTYCRRVDEVRLDLARRSERWYQPLAPLAADTQEWPFTKEDLAYEEF